MILNDISIATEGYVGPIPTSPAYCPDPISIGTHGYVRFAFTGAGMADPRARHREPLDLGYYIWKYGKPKQRKQLEAEQPQVAAKARESLMRELAQVDKREADLAAEAALAERRSAELAADIARLEGLYQRANSELALALATEIATADEQARAQERLIAELEQDFAAARTALIIAIEARRRLNNQLAGIEAAIRFYY